jgi:hypothetical protein
MAIITVTTTKYENIGGSQHADLQTQRKQKNNNKKKKTIETQYPGVTPSGTSV